MSPPFILDTNVRDIRLGAVLSQAFDSGERVIAYFSCALSGPEKNYCITWRKLLAVVAALKLQTIPAWANIPVTE